jgi:hypothetical protein
MLQKKVSLYDLSHDTQKVKDILKNAVWETLSVCSAPLSVILEINNTSSYQLRRRTAL